VTATVDARLIDIVFRTLLLNSAQAVAGRGRILVSVEAVPDACRVAITDDGPGIPPAIRERIFLPFFTTKERGTGLGLSTARRFVEAHGGTISVELPAIGGTRMMVQLPLGCPEAGLPALNRGDC
jgi:signal transduction histidine kinase